MSDQSCTCPDLQSCSCNGWQSSSTPRPNPYMFTTHLTPTPTPQPHWSHQLLYTYTPHLTPGFSSQDSRVPTPFQASASLSPLSLGFCNQFQATCVYISLPLTPSLH